MKTFKLIVIAGGGRVSQKPDAIVKGFVEAEKTAKELIDQYINDYPYDTYVACVEDESEMNYTNYLCMVQDCDGEKFWMMMEYGYYCPIGLRLLTDVEQESIDLLREENETHIWELNEEQLKKLRSEIRVGSCYRADYKNSFEIDEDEVCEYSDGYLDYIDEIGCEDTQEAFAEYCMQLM